MAQSTLDTSKDVCVLVREDLAYKRWACQASELMYFMHSRSSMQLLVACSE